MRSSLNARAGRVLGGPGAERSGPRVRLIGLGSLAALLLSVASFAQAPSSLAEREAAALIQKMKSAERGPFSRVRWYCADGTVQPPRAYA
ncbi:MAG: hypothetical protein HY702_01220, partial [Gemmatimonadetes bacterium]|nr:hypothetical protein [Gemmatimonadota bacterium]